MNGGDGVLDPLGWYNCNKVDAKPAGDIVDCYLVQTDDRQTIIIFVRTDEVNKDIDQEGNINACTDECFQIKIITSIGFLEAYSNWHPANNINKQKYQYLIPYSLHWTIHQNYDRVLLFYYLTLMIFWLNIDIFSGTISNNFYAELVEDSFNL